MDSIIEFIKTMEMGLDDDFVDKLHHTISPAIMLTMAGFVLLKDKIECWAPAEIAFNSQWMSYSENLCYAEVRENYAYLLLLPRFGFPVFGFF
jgi:hypothetical protein